jgi:hypothetical protein
VLGCATWYLWPATRGARNDVVVIGDGAVGVARDELARRFRQEGLVPLVVVTTAADCERAVTAAPPDVDLVISFSEPDACANAGRSGLVVQQPGTAAPVRPHGEWTVRSASPLFVGALQSVPCSWWDIPGAGEARPGLGRCTPDGTVRVLDGGTLTEAGRERFARLVVEAVR